MKKGMNPEAVEQMGQAISQAGDDALARYKEAEGDLDGLDWTGEDRDRFVSEFSDQIGQLAEEAKRIAGELDERARNNAQEQRTASE